jgi:small redox-active disulfide protein 2
MMSNKNEIVLADESSSCFCSGALPHYDLKNEPEANTQPERILVLGAGCPKCRALEQTVKKALDERNETFAVGHVTDYAEMAKYGVMSTPALVIDGKVVSAGRVLSQKDVARLLNENL